ncbi:hypothetical protein [Parapedobacter sp. DT-150]|uniref:hypothetical protein n=1 Tax=Parapedobacter sp. DT-150 TaxID=3396162 RepID=UPI003F1ADA5D
MILKSMIASLAISLTGACCFAQNTFPTSGNAGIGITSPLAMLHIRTYTGAAPTYPSTTSRGDIFGVLQADNNAMELGVAKGSNTRRAWILARHASTADFGQYYATLHLQPALESTTQYRGVAIGYPASSTIPLQVGLVVNGNVGIGTTDPQAKLAVNGNILAKEVKVKTDISVPDYVFEPDYELPALADVGAYVKEHKHLPEIPSAADIERDGLDLAEMNLLLLKKVEELTLYLIEKDEQLAEFKKIFMEKLESIERK